MNILGINAYHGDASACLLVNGSMIAAAEEERFRRIKHWAGLPVESIKYCLSEAGFSLGDISQIAVNQDASANLWKKIGFTVASRPNFQMVLDRLRNKRERAFISVELNKLGIGRFTGQEHTVEHHLAHMASAFYVSPFKEAAIVSVDGFGDFASTSWGYGIGNEIAIDDKIYFPHSLGIFYQAMTQWLGFSDYGDEYKVMGLAPYGEPKYMTQMRQILRLHDNGIFSLSLEYFRHHNEKVPYEWDGGEPKVGQLFSPLLIELLGPARQKGGEITKRHMDIARSVQEIYEEAFFSLLIALHARHGGESIALAGGCAMNSVANGKISKKSRFKHVYIQSAAGDAGGAIGSALQVWHKLGGKRCFEMKHAYWGPEFSNDEIHDLLLLNQSKLDMHRCMFKYIADLDRLCARAAEAISNGLVVGWFQGRMEWGPRALGNRSILGDPRRADMKDILNLKIKRRESFRPFAPSILEEYVTDWFESGSEVPFMMQVYPIRAEKRSVIPAVTHVDGSGRLQTVSKETNPRYHKLISEFNAITGIPMVLNTSFNENEPVVCKPSEALECFLRTKMDVLVMGDWYVSRSSLK